MSRALKSVFYFVTITGSGFLLLKLTGMYNENYGFGAEIKRRERELKGKPEELTEKERIAQLTLDYIREISGIKKP
ncbi:UNVERIFIED_CONTAM: hypothetical protein RMT77_018278 [Armadillidium vulgare]